jgi:hypothetical protein
MPYRTSFSAPDCAGQASSSPFSNNAMIGGCYLVPWPFDLNVRMTCGAGASSLSFNIGSSCDTSPFLSLTYPTGVCINDPDGFGSSIYNCGAPMMPTNGVHASNAIQTAQISQLPYLDKEDDDPQGKRPTPKTELTTHVMKDKTSSFTDIIRRHPLSASNPLLKRLLKQMH